MDKLQTAINTLLTVKVEVLEAPKVLSVISLLNEIKDEFEDCRIHKNDYTFSAMDKNTGEVIKKDGCKKLAETLGVSSKFIGQCISGKRNSRKYVFWKEEIYDSSF